jgi:uncharacterized protein YukE
METSKVYQLYQAATVEYGSHLTEAEFQEFWSGISAEEHQYWVAQFRTGHTNISRELCTDIRRIFGQLATGLPPPDEVKPKLI